MTSDDNARYTDIHPPESGSDAVPTDVDTSPGQLLARRREALGLSVQQVADELHLTMHYIRALEADAHDKLPGVVFIRGYVRAYATYLKLDPTVLVNVFNEFVAQRDGGAEEAGYSISRRRRDRNRPWIVISGIAFVAIAVALWYFGTGPGAPVATPAASSTGSAAAAVPAALDGAASPRAAAVSASSVTPAAASTPTPAPVGSAGFAAQAPTASTPAIGGPSAVQSATIAATPAAPADAATPATAVVADAVPVGGTPAFTAPPAAQPVAAAVQATPAVTAAAGTAAPLSAASAATTSAPSAPVAPNTTATPDASPVPVSSPTPAASATSAQDAQASVSAASATLAASPQRVMPTQIISVDAGGSDLVEILFSGESLVQIDDGSARQIYRDIRVAGDHLRVNGTGPFNVLLGDAATAELHLNGKKIDFSESIRIDNSARLTIGL